MGKKKSKTKCIPLHQFISEDSKNYSPHHEPSSSPFLFKSSYDCPRAIALPFKYQNSIYCIDQELNIYELISHKNNTVSFSKLVFKSAEKRDMWMIGTNRVFALFYPPLNCFIFAVEEIRKPLTLYLLNPKLNECKQISFNNIGISIARNTHVHSSGIIMVARGYNSKFLTISRLNINAKLSCDLETITVIPDCVNLIASVLVNDTVFVIETDFTVHSYNLVKNKYLLVSEKQPHLLKEQQQQQKQQDSKSGHKLHDVQLYGDYLIYFCGIEVQENCYYLKATYFHIPTSCWKESFELSQVELWHSHGILNTCLIPSTGDVHVYFAAQPPMFKRMNEFEVECLHFIIPPAYYAPPTLFYNSQVKQFSKQYAKDTVIVTQY